MRLFPWGGPALGVAAPSLKGAPKGRLIVLPPHPARTLQYEELWNGLQAAKAARLVSEEASADGLRIYNYTETCVYDSGWNPFTRIARGLVLDPVARRVVATPFPKFFNWGETDESFPDLPFEVYEKLDGSMIVLFQHEGVWRTATRGSFISDQAVWAAERLRGQDLSSLDPEATYLAEAVYPENRVVVRYDFAGLVLLGAYDGQGREVEYDALSRLAERLGWPIARRRSFVDFAELAACAASLPATEEGFVVRFSNGRRLKLKGEEYRRVHRAICRLTPLAVWETLAAGEPLEPVRRGLPEEFWEDLDRIERLLQRRLDALIAAVKAAAESVAELSDKEVGLRIESFPEAVRRFIFPYRKSGGNLMASPARDALFRSIRPVGDRLEGYARSSSTGRAQREDS